MFKDFANSPGPTMRNLWERLSPLPGGKTLFSRAIGMMAPYTGTVGATVVELRPGFSRVEMRDRKKVRNHLNSIHAVALVNLAELTTGAAMISALPPGARGILAGLSIDYLKKARGTLTAECSIEVEDSTERREIPVEGVIRNAEGEPVARATARWLVGPSSSS